MRNVPSPLVAWLATKPQSIFLADLITITLADGVTVYRWTTAELSLSVGGNTYQSEGTNLAPGILVGDYNNQLLPAVDTLDVTLIGGSFTIGGRTLAQLATSGYFDGGARIRLDHLMGPDPVTAVSWGGITALFEGRIGQCAPQSSTQIVLHCDAETITLAQPRPLVVIQPSCNYAVYDANCGLSRAAFTLSGAVSAASASAITTASAALTAKASGYFNLGVVTFTSGALNGISADVETWNGSTFRLSGVPLSAAPAAGDTFTVYPGCALTRADCGGKFSNIGTSGHWRGFDRVPSAESGSN